MRIKNIHLSNYKRFTDLKVTDIPKSTRLVVLVGPNGSGKSSLFDAFLLKAWSHRNNYNLDGGNYRGYYIKNPLISSYIHSAQLANEAVVIDFHDNVLDSNDWGRFFNIRSAYRNEADFETHALEPVRPSHSTTRFHRIIDSDQSVSDNYKRLAWKRMSDLDKDADGSMTFDQYRRESLADIQAAMKELFTDPALELRDFGGVSDAGVFRFSKGGVKDFHYKNLSGGEKAAFDLLLDIFIKRTEYQDAVYCIDEAEAHVATALHGPLLRAMFNLIPIESQLWIATHSIGFIRQAFELKKQGVDVVFLNFSGRDFDQQVIIEPEMPKRSFWQEMYRVALDDLSGLIAPKNIVICEGNKEQADKGFDAECYNKIFSDKYPETLFVSYGSSSDVIKNEHLMNILTALAQDVNVFRLIDRDDKNDEERNREIENGVCVLGRREIENYLYDPEVLKRFLKQNGKCEYTEAIMSKYEELLPSEIDFAAADVKCVTQQLLHYIKQTTNLPFLADKRTGFALQHLAPALAATSCVYDELVESVFNPGI